MRPVGMKATIRFLIVAIFQRVFQYKKMTDVIAPSWIIISKLFWKFVWSIPSKLLAKMRCPVDEIGRNSVIPSIIPRIMECNMVMKIINAKLLNRYQT